MHLYIGEKPSGVASACSAGPSVDNMSIDEVEALLIRKVLRRCDGNISQAAEALALHRFVESYRQLAQLFPPELRPGPLGALLEQVVLLQQGHVADPGLRIELDPGPPVTLRANSCQLEQMFIDLLANAVDAALASNAQPVRIGWQIVGAAVSIHIDDRGQGIANADHLFVPSYTIKPAGSGVGPALAQQIARAHGGEIRLQSRQDGPGARATIRLPLPPR